MCNNSPLYLPSGRMGECAEDLAGLKPITEHAGPDFIGAVGERSYCSEAVL